MCLNSHSKEVYSPIKNHPSSKQVFVFLILASCSLFFHNMSSILTSQGVVLAAVMAVSSTAVIFLAFSKQKTLAHQLFETRDSQSPTPCQNLRSCLCSEGKGKQKKKKRVQFAENVKDTKGNGEEYRREKQNSWFLRREREISNTRMSRVCRNETQGNHGMPENRIALYIGILRDRVHRIECSY